MRFFIEVIILIIESAYDTFSLSGLTLAVALEIEEGFGGPAWA